MDDGNRIGVIGFDRGDVLRVVDGEAQDRTDVPRLTPNRQCSDDLRHAASVIPVLPDPARPVVEKALAYLGLSTVNLYGQPGPDLLGRESVPRESIVNVDIPLPLPVVSRGVPNREAAVCVCVDDQSGAPWPSRLSGPALILNGIRALEAPAVSGIGRQRETQLRRPSNIRRARRIARGQTLIQVAGPFARQRPPSDIQQEALAEPVCRR